MRSRPGKRTRDQTARRSGHLWLVVALVLCIAEIVAGVYGIGWVRALVGPPLVPAALAVQRYGWARGYLAAKAEAGS